MAITATLCHVLGTTVTRVTDLEGNVERVICPHYDETKRTCTLGADALRGGPLAQLLERVASIRSAAAAGGVNLPDARRAGAGFPQAAVGQDAHMPSPHVFWHRELPPVNAQPMGAHVIDATSGRVPGTLEYRDAMWDRCYRELMAHVTERIGQEVVRLGGDCARVLAERIEQRRDERTGEAWMYGRFEYELYRR